MIYGSMNKGDWGEIYCLLYLLGKRELISADENLNAVPNSTFPLIKSIREEKIPVPSVNNPTINHIEFELPIGTSNVEIYFNSQHVRTLSSADFQKEAQALCHDILDEDSHVPVLNSKGQPLFGMFTIPHSEAFINSIYCQRLAAASDDITDLKFELHDIISGSNRVVGFSAKSYLGSLPTLFNASGATNFIYSVTGISNADMVAINQLTLSKRVSEIYNRGGTLTYLNTSNKVFTQNLRKLDGDMENILARALLYFYKDKIINCIDIVQQLENDDPLNVTTQGFYTYKFKRFLCAKALGLQPSKPWSGEDDANGGYIVAKSNGEVLAFHLYDRDKFKRYLLDSTKFERADTGKHKFGKIEADPNGNMSIKLNLQIRFRK